MGITASQLPRLIQHELNFRKIKRLMVNKECDSLLQACQILNCNYANLYAYIKKYHKDFECTRSRNGNRKLNNDIKQKKLKIKATDLEDIKRLYFKEKLNMQQIAKRYNCTAAVVCHYFKKFNIVSRTKSEILKERFNDPKFREKVRQNNIKNYLKRRKYNTKPEQDFVYYCQSNNIEFIEQYRHVGNGHPYDFFLPKYNLLVEIDGTYWHSFPKQQLKDQQHVDDAIKKGYNIVRIDTTELAQSQGDYNKWLKIFSTNNMIIQK